MAKSSYMNVDLTPRMGKRPTNTTNAERIIKKIASSLKNQSTQTKSKTKSKTTNKQSNNVNTMGDIKLFTWKNIHKMPKKYLAPLRLTKPIILEEYNNFSLKCDVNRCSHYTVINNSRDAMTDMIENYYFDATIPSGSPLRTQPLMYKSIETIFTITNATNAPAQLWIYEAGLRDDVNLTTQQLAQTGYQEETDENDPADLTYLYPFKSLFAVDQVKQKVYCQKLHKRYMTPGQTLQYKSIRGINRMVTLNDMADTAALYPATFGSFTTFQIQGMVAAESTADRTKCGLNGVDLKVTFLQRRVIQQINDKQSHIVRKTTVDPITFDDDQVLNPFPGVHQDVTDD